MLFDIWGQICYISTLETGQIEFLKLREYLMKLLSFKNFTAVVAVLLLAAACQSEEKEQQSETGTVKAKAKLFELIPASQSGVDMVNVIEEDNKHNFFLDEYYFNGAGVSVGDVNNDGLVDIFLTGNRVPNKLYINMGDFVFRDMSEKAGVDPSIGDRGEQWASGSTMVDVNGDGLLDIYVCRGTAFQEDPNLNRNFLLINNGDTTFTERAAEYGLDDERAAVQAAFFDYDMDGDLDMYVANHSVRPSWFEGEMLDAIDSPRDEETDALYRNNGDGTFSDVSHIAGIRQLSYGLGLAIGDLNEDGWPDIYVANDFLVPDVYYENNQDGTFTNRLEERFKHTSNFAMGSDISDLNNDGYLDLVVADMTASDNYRQKVMMESMNIPLFWSIVNGGGGWQYMRNTLQMNNGNGSFSEVSQYSGIHYTDWSWSTLFADMENDGYKDLFITNGYLRDVKDKDFKKKFEAMEQDLGGQYTKGDINKILNSTKLTNYIFKNNGDLTFTNRSFEYGFGIATWSNGAAYADIDNDGDLDLVIANINEVPFIYKNMGKERAVAGNHLQVTLKGPELNRFGIGAKIKVTSNGVTQYQEMQLTRGYQSSVAPMIHVGLADAERADVIVDWPDGKRSIVSGAATNQQIEVNIADASDTWSPTTIGKTLFTEIDGPSFEHKEQIFDDYKLEILIPHKMSQFGPHISVGDANGDGQEDFYVGGAGGQAGQLFIQAGSKFSAKKGPWAGDAAAEDLGSAFFDADADGDQDLYVVSGSNEFGANVEQLNDRLYINDGKGNFKRDKEALPERLFSGSCVVPGDFDKDGDQDLFVGGRQTPLKYPYPGKSAILQNQGGKFVDITASVAPDLVDIGMVTSATWVDYDGDSDEDLILVGEWMPITVLENNDGQYQNMTKELGLQDELGWWNKLVKADMDGDGDMDFIAGNYGLNSKFPVSKEEPLHIYCSDFDETGTLDIVLGWYNQGVCYPVRGKQCSSEQMPNISDKFPTYDEFGKATITDVYGERLDEALHYEVKNFATVYIENTGDGLKVHRLPKEVQFSTVFGILPDDFNNDGNMDLLIAGNFYVPEVETGRTDASIGVYLRGDGSGGFTSVPVTESGFFAWEDVRDLAQVRLANGKRMILVGNNNDKMQSFVVQ
jgi:hypothetical protein